MAAAFLGFRGVEVRRGDGQAQEGVLRLLLARALHRDHISHRVPQISHGDRRLGPERRLEQFRRQPQKSRGVGFVGGIAHGDQRRLAQPQALLEHEASRWWLGSTHKSPSHAGLAELIEEAGLHQKRLTADEAPPLAGVAVGIAAEIEAVEHLHQGFKGRELVQPAAAQQFQGGLPVVVPAALCLERINGGGLWPHTAVVMHRFHDGAPVAAAHIPDHAVDVEQQQSSRYQGVAAAAGRLVVCD